MLQWEILVTAWGILAAVVLVRWRLVRASTRRRTRLTDRSQLPCSAGPIFVMGPRPDPSEEAQRLAEVSREARRLEPLDPRD
jgi:hypothetical protein